MEENFVIVIIIIILFILHTIRMNMRYMTSEYFLGSDWNTQFWGVQSWNGWPY